MILLLNNNKLSFDRGLALCVFPSCADCSVFWLVRLCVTEHTYLCNWVMSCIHTEGAGSSHRLSSERRTSTTAFSVQGPTGPSAGTQYSAYLYSTALSASEHPSVYRLLQTCSEIILSYFHVAINICSQTRSSQVQSVNRKRPSGH